MASIQLRASSYRAEVARKGIRRSATFSSLAEAQAWAERTEIEIVGEHKPPPMAVHLAATCYPDLTDSILHEESVLALPRWGRVCGIYFLILDDEIVYIGKSADVHARVSQHRYKYFRVFDSYTIIACAPERLSDLERYYIQEFAPRLNSAGL